MGSVLWRRSGLASAPRDRGRNPWALPAEHQRHRQRDCSGGAGCFKCHVGRRKRECGIQEHHGSIASDPGPDRSDRGVIRAGHHLLWRRTTALGRSDAQRTWLQPLPGGDHVRCAVWGHRPDRSDPGGHRGHCMRIAGRWCAWLRDDRGQRHWGNPCVKRCLGHDIGIGPWLCGAQLGGHLGRSGIQSLLWDLAQLFLSCLP